MPKVYICDIIEENGINLLRSCGFIIDINKSGKDLTFDELEKVLSSYDAVITMVNNKIDERLIKSAARTLKVIANYAVGVDNIDLETSRKKKIVVCNTPGVASESVAEHTIALIFALKKRLFAADNFVRSGRFFKFDPNLFLSRQLWGQTLGVVGLGGIGTFIAQIAYGGFRMKVLYFDTERSEDFELIYSAQFCDVETILKQADVVTLHVPLTPETRHLIGRRELKLMKNSAILINTARGPIVDEEALIWALREKEIGGVALDVFEHEPQIDRELFTFDNVIVTPHIASATIETRQKMSEITAQNIIDVFEGKEPMGLVKV